MPATFLLRGLRENVTNTKFKLRDHDARAPHDSNEWAQDRL